MHWWSLILQRSSLIMHSTVVISMLSYFMASPSQLSVKTQYRVMKRKIDGNFSFTVSVFPCNLTTFTFLVKVTSLIGTVYVSFKIRNISLATVTLSPAD